ncbi:ribonuclease P protein component [Stieleria varia]|uniref:Ribonuclease P protein component n=1 Tax=Stieleria varia TaxID=2528005 RepID=A0A5C6AU46_9BACT|nr:ribonuclease P protein component [Stieleria varia]TWU02729.1 Ribonuclease P protein component [Stieleria varia]
MSFRFSKTRRIASSDRFTLVLRRGVCAADGTLVVFAMSRGDQQPSRLGVTIPKKAGNAVARNHWKRLIRESFRTQQDRIPDGFDFVVRPKKDAQADWGSIRKGLPKLALKAIRRAGEK